MKRFVELEPNLRINIKGKKAKRFSFKRFKKYRNKSFRQHLKSNPDGVKDYKMNYDFEF